MDWRRRPVVHSRVAARINPSLITERPSTVGLHHVPGVDVHGHDDLARELVFLGHGANESL